MARKKSPIKEGSQTIPQLHSGAAPSSFTGTNTIVTIQVTPARSRQHMLIFILLDASSLAQKANMPSMLIPIKM